MAKKKLELDKVKLDSELDFGFSMDDDIDAMINPDAKKPKKRTPVTDIAMGTITGAKSKLKDPSFIAEMTRKALPEQYGEIFDTTDKVSGALSSLYDETIREIKPELSRVAKKVDKLIPEESKFFKKLSSKFSEMMGNEMSGFKGQDVKQQQEQAIQNSIAAVFQEQQTSQIEEKARDSAQDRINRAVDQKRFTSNISILRSIDQGISRLSQYNDKVTQAYQKKSLELQYRSFFVQSEQLDVSKRYFEVFKAQHEAIAKNTALPEFVKISDSERFKDQLKTKFIGNVQKSLFGDGDIINTAIERLKKKTKESAMVFKQALEAGSMGLDEVESVRDMQRMMAEAGIEGDSAATMLGNVMGGGIVNNLGNKLGRKLRSGFDDETKVGQFGYKAANVLRNIPGQYDKLRNSEFLRENEFESGTKGFLAKGGNFILDLLRPEGPKTTVSDAAGLKGINDIAPGFTNKAIKSLTDVIPGYLARIYREVASIRSGSEAELVSYDFNKGTFLTQSALTKDIKDILNAKANSSFNRINTDNAISNLLEGVEVDDDTKKDFGVIIRALAQQRSDYSAESVQKSDVLQGTGSKELFNKLVANKTSTARGQYEFTRSMSGVKDSFPNLMADIETFVNAGYGDILESEGLIKRNEKGGLEVDIEAYKKLLEDNIVSSDVNVKRNITSMNPKDALAAVKNTKIYNWFYKLGKGDKKPHIGPMAQDVNSQLGNEAAPGGTKIDLTTMNGVNMAAIQALKDEHDQLAESDKGQDWLKQIKQDTTAIVELMQKGGGSPGLSMNKDDLKEVLSLRKGFYTSVVEPVIQGSFKAITGLFGTVQKGATITKDNAINPFITFVTKSYKDNKPWVQDSLKDLFKGAGDLATKLFDFGKTTLFDTIPNSVKSTWAFGTNIKDKVITETTTDTDASADTTVTKTDSQPVVNQQGKGKETWNDRDGSGKRDGDWRDRLANTKQKTTNFLKADLKEKYRGENVIDLIGQQAKKLLGFLSDKAGGLFSKVGSIAEAGLGSLGKLGSTLKGIPGKILGMGKTAAGAVMTGVNKVGKVGGLIKKVGSVAKIGRLAGIANVARGALGVGSLLTAGTGSAILAGASTAIAGLGSILASPVVLSAATIAAVGYGGYKLYKYTTRDNIDLYESIRIKQYGLTNSEHDKHHIHELLALEEYLQDGRIGYDEGKAYLLDKKIDVEEMLGLFSIDPNDDEQVGIFTQWFESRFKPFFLNHLTAFYLFDNKGSLSDVKKLNAVDKAKYLGIIGFESGPYDVTLSPFKDIDTLHSDPKIVKATIEEALEESKKEIDSKDKSPLDVAADKLRQVKALRDSDYWKKKSEQARQTVESVKNTIEQGISSTTSFAGQMWNKGTEAAKSAYQSTTAAVGQAYDKTKEVVGQAYDIGKKAAGQAGEWIGQNIVTPVKDSLSGLIQRAESGSKGYNAYNRGTSGNKILPPVGPRNLTGMTLSQILEDSQRPKEDPQRLFAVGKYQMIPTTMRDGIKKLGINPETTLYNEATQERLFSDYLLDKKRPKISAYIKGKSEDANAALNDAASEWASLPDPRTGVSKYGSGNHASVKVPTLLSALSQSRDLYKKYISEGMPERDAYQKAVSGGGSGSISTSMPTGGPTIENASKLAANSPKTPSSPTVENANTASMGGIVDSVISNSSPVKTDTTSPVTQAASTVSGVYSASVTGSGPKVAGNASTGIAEYNSFNSTPAPSYTGKTSTGQGQGMSLPGLEKTLDHVGETLDQSLDVQRQMLNTLRDILANVNPENIQRVQEGLKQVSAATKPSSELSKPAVDLMRKSA